MTSRHSDFPPLRAARLLSLWLLGFCVCHSSAVAQPGKDKDPLSWDRHMHQVFSKYCYGCHGESQARGGVVLSQDEDPRQILDHRSTWETALSMIEVEEMPPEKSRQPSKKERQLMIEFLTQTLNSLDCETLQNPGPAPLRRLNNTEYDNTIFDLTGLDLHLAEDFPPDASSYGFDNIGEALTLSPALIERYHAAAQHIAETLVSGKQTHPQAFRKLYFAQAGKASDERATARKIIERFATEAFRRPVEPDFVKQLLAVYDKAREKQETHEQAVGRMVTAVLISPSFLMRIEHNQPETTEPFLIDDYELASRLSYFLWSRPPDDELLQLARKNELSKPDVLDRQAQRMLKDPRSEALVRNFFGQWLELRDVSSHQPDRDQFPDFNNELRAAMQQEAWRLLAEIVQQDAPVTDIIDADHIYLNAELAEFYDIPVSFESGWKRVELKDRRRGGLLTSAAVLMLNSDPTRTNVPRRGNYIAGRILGAPPPPPPPTVPALEAVITKGRELTGRQLLELHRANAECAGCHAKIDPLGFSFENYDAIGRWRDREAGTAIDSSGELPDGRKFSGPVELKQILMKEKPDFLRTLSTNLLIYALGRGLKAEDECVIRDMIAASTASEYRFSPLVQTIVTSVPFRYRRNVEF